MYKIEIYDSGNYQMLKFDSLNEAELKIKELLIKKEARAIAIDGLSVVKEDGGFALVGKYNHVWYSARIV